MARLMPSEEATNVVRQRQTTYGHPAEVYGRWSLMVGAILGCECSVYQAGLILAALKIAREAGIRQWDNRVDMCGYANVLEMIDEWEEEHGVRGTKTDTEPTPA